MCILAEELASLLELMQLRRETNQMHHVRRPRPSGYGVDIASNMQPCLAAEWAFSEGNETIMRSPKEGFELRIFRGKTENWYMGIFSTFFPDFLSVWVANRDEPLPSSTGILKIFNSNLVLLNQSGGIVWQTNSEATAETTVAELLDNGNFVLRHSNNSNRKIVWQSFQHPTNTLLPGMEFGSGSSGRQRILTSWSGFDDPSSGRYSCGIEIPASGNGYVETFVSEDERDIYRMDPAYNTRYNYEKLGYSLQVRANTEVGALTLSLFGYLLWLELGAWTNMSMTSPSEECDSYNRCGGNSYCLADPIPTCACFRGFRQSQEGCVRKSPPSCSDIEFQWLTKMKLPFFGSGTIVHREMEFKECEEKCLLDCNCTAFANTAMPNGGSGCAIWTGDLLDIRRYSTDQGQDLYVRTAAAEIREERSKRSKKKRIIAFTTGASALLLLGAVLLSFWKRSKLARARTAAGFVTTRRENNQDHLPVEVIDESKSAFMDFDLIAEATDNFSVANEIGKGGFGVVYKGRLLDGKAIAVKRLKKHSAAGIEGFHTEVSLISVLQHVNMVRLLGYFYDDQEKILVYELLENSSLDTYLFGTTRSFVLNWDQRFDITNGIARGLLYLHQDSRCRIVHLDIKASNILLGRDLVPKISDFGMAKILHGDDTEGYATSAGGTYGYMAPEYALSMLYSVKSDVFSFGVLLLEIVSGKSTREFSRLNDGDNLLRFIWRNWSEGKGLEMVDPYMVVDSSTSYRPEQVLRCVIIGLACVQGNPEDRPTMSWVVLMLGSESEITLLPKPPLEDGSSSRVRHRAAAVGSSSVPQVTDSVLQPR